MNGIKARMKADGTVVGRLSRSNPDYADNLTWIKREAQVNNWELTMDGVGKSVTFKLAERPVNESSRFGFNVGDEVELTSDVEPNRFSDRGVVSAGTVGEVVAVDKPMRGVIKVKIEDGTVVSVPERKLKFAGTDNEPWEKFKKPPEPPRNIKPERPEDYYMRPTSYGSPRYTGD
jgi:hypothetical protein